MVIVREFRICCAGRLKDDDFLQPNLEVKRPDAKEHPAFSAHTIMERIKKRAAIYADPMKYANDQILKMGVRCCATCIIMSLFRRCYIMS